MIISIIFNIIFIIAIGILIVYLRHQHIHNIALNNILEMRIDNFSKNTRILLDENKSYKKKVKNLETSIRNLKNALSYKPIKDGKRYTFINSIDDGLQDVVIFFDEELTYTLEYYGQKVLCDKEKFVQSRNFDCLVFIDGKTFDPIIISEFTNTTKIVSLTDINCNKYLGRGLGTHIVQNLITILRDYKIETLTAALSSVDFKRKKELYNFYINKNGFELVSELREHQWGKVIRKII